MLGNDDPKASVVGEIIPGKEFYDYEAKYLSEGSVPVIPAKLTRAESKQIREMAVAAFRACDLSGLARVDFLMEPDGKRRIFLNEVNTLPGFTQISMYPKLWEATGISYSDLITRLIELALERHAGKEPQHLQQRRIAASAQCRPTVSVASSGTGNRQPQPELVSNSMGGICANVRLPALFTGP